MQNIESSLEKRNLQASKENFVFDNLRQYICDKKINIGMNLKEKPTGNNIGFWKH